MGFNITRREKDKRDYQVAAVTSGVSFALSILALILFIKSEEK